MGRSLVHAMTREGVWRKKQRRERRHTVRGGRAKTGVVGRFPRSDAVRNRIHHLRGVPPPPPPIAEDRHLQKDDNQQQHALQTPCSPPCSMHLRRTIRHRPYLHCPPAFHLCRSRAIPSKEAGDLPLFFKATPGREAKGPQSRPQEVPRAHSPTGHVTTLRRVYVSRGATKCPSPSDVSPLIW